MPLKTVTGKHADPRKGRGAASRGASENGVLAAPPIWMGTMSAPAVTAIRATARNNRNAFAPGSTVRGK